MHTENKPVKHVWRDKWGFIESRILRNQWHPINTSNVFITCVCIGNQYTCHVSSYQITFSANLNLYLC